jgi:glutamyl-tRNA reductase
LNSLKSIAFTHKKLPLETIGAIHLTEEQQVVTLGALKMHFELRELCFISTCNRVELIIDGQYEWTPLAIKELILFLNPKINNKLLDELSQGLEYFEGDEAVNHLFRVASSLDSLVVGEREIITQVRKAYDFCNMMGLTGDTIRLLIKQTIETAKTVYTDTDIARNPVSVVSLAYRQLRDFGIKTEARILMIGSGETNTAMANYLNKHQFKNLVVFNRTLTNAKKLAGFLKAKALPLSDLSSYKDGFDVIITCTGAHEVILTEDIYRQLLNNESSKKVIVDLALPSDTAIEIIEKYPVHYIDLNSLKKQADENLQRRQNEISSCETIIANKIEAFKWLHKERKIEIAFGEIPRQVKAIHELACNEVFAKDINGLDEGGREVIQKVLAYVEKKYNALAMKTAKDVLLNGKN